MSEKKPLLRVACGPAFGKAARGGFAGAPAQWNWASSVEPVSALTEELPPWITVVTSSK